MRLLVTGSRDWTRISAIRRMLYLFHEDYPDSILVSGHAPKGADAIAEHVWSHIYGFDMIQEAIGAGRIEIYPANWDKYGRKAGMIRNKQMVDTGPDFYVAFGNLCTLKKCFYRGPHGSHGTAQCVKLAREAGIPEYA
jgi:hypothetical protein